MYSLSSDTRRQRATWMPRTSMLTKTLFLNNYHPSQCVVFELSKVRCNKHYLIAPPSLMHIKEICMQTF
jgi:hypothetical protein